MSGVVEHLVNAIADAVYTGPAGSDATVRRLWRYKPIRLDDLHGLFVTVLPQPSGFSSQRDARELIGSTVTIEVYLQKRGDVDDMTIAGEWAAYVEDVASRFHIDCLPGFKGIHLVHCLVVLFNETAQCLEMGIFESLLRLTYRFDQPVPAM